MELNNNFWHKKIPSPISLIVLLPALAFSLWLIYSALNSPLLYFAVDQAASRLPPDRLSRQEYREFLLEQRVEIIEEIQLGQIKGKPNFKENIAKYDAILRDAAKKYRVDCTLIKATMLAESQGKPKVRSSRGAVGLMQLMPLTAQKMGYASNLHDPRVNIMAGAKYMALLKEKACHEKPKNDVCDVSVDVKFRLAAYNGGPKCNKPGGGRCAEITTWECELYDAYGQTRRYVDKVKANYRELKDKRWGC